MTGSDVEGKLNIDHDRCVVCGACIAVCPTEALIIEGAALKLYLERCRPCGQAAFVCPTGALTCPERQETDRDG